jgi:hypothetical protein
MLYMCLLIVFMMIVYLPQGIILLSMAQEGTWAVKKGEILTGNPIFLTCTPLDQHRPARAHTHKHTYMEIEGEEDIGDRLEMNKKSLKDWCFK